MRAATKSAAKPADTVVADEQPTTPVADEQPTTPVADEQPATPTPDAEPQPQQPATPTAVADVKTELVAAYFGRLTIHTPGADDEIVMCPHTRYGHESQKAAEKCVRSVAAQRGLKVS